MEPSSRRKPPQPSSAVGHTPAVVVQHDSSGSAHPDQQDSSSSLFSTQHSLSSQDAIFANLQVVWQWQPKKSHKTVSSVNHNGDVINRSYPTRLPTVVFVSIPDNLSSTRMFLYDRGNVPLPQSAPEVTLMDRHRMISCLNESPYCFKIGGLQDGVSDVMLSRFLLRIANIRLAGAICRSRGMWCVALHNPAADMEGMLSLHEKFWFTPLGIIDVSSPTSAAEVNVMLEASRQDTRTKGYPRHLMTVTRWAPNTQPQK